MSTHNKEHGKEELLDLKLIETKVRAFMENEVDTCGDYHYEEGERYPRQCTMIKIEQKTKQHREQLLYTYIQQLETQCQSLCFYFYFFC